MKANMLVGMHLLATMVVMASMLPVHVMAAEGSQADKDVFVKKFGPGKVGALTSAGLGYAAVKSPLQGLKGAAYSAGDAVDALSKGKICDAVGHTILAPVHAAAGVVIGAGALIASPFPAIVGGGMAAYNGITGSKKGENTFKMKKDELRDVLADPRMGNKAKLLFNKKDMSQIYDRDRNHDNESRQLERSRSSSSHQGQARSSSGRAAGRESGDTRPLQRSVSGPVRPAAESSHRSGGSRPSQSQRTSSSTTSHGGQKASGGSSRSASRPPTTSTSVRPSESKSKSGPKSLTRSATTKHR